MTKALFRKYARRKLNQVIKSSSSSFRINNIACLQSEISLAFDVGKSINKRMSHVAQCLRWLMHIDTDVSKGWLNPTLATMSAGQSEYAHGVDNAFDNFERLAASMGLTRDQVLRVYLQKHIDGIRAWMEGHKSQRESVRGRIQDAIVYLLLYSAMLHEDSEPTVADKVDHSSLTIQELIQDSWQTAEDKGWHERTREVPELIALVHSELSEALEEYRKPSTYETDFYIGDCGKPEGVAVEFADVVIRIADAACCLNLPLENALRAKLAYNKTREHRHGGKKV